MNRIFKYALMFAFVGIAIFAISQMSDEAEAADIVWDGGGVDNLASTKENWVGDANPVSWDTVKFNTNTKDCTFDLNIIAECVINNDYVNTVDFANGRLYSLVQSSGTILINKNNMDVATIVQSGGTFEGNNNNIKIYNGYSITGGINRNVNLIYVDVGNLKTGSETLKSLSITTGTVTQTGIIRIGSGGLIQTGGSFIRGNYLLECNLNGGTITTLNTPTWDYLNITGSNIFSQNVYCNNTLLNGQWTGNIYYNDTADISTNQQHWTGWLYTQNDIAIEYNAYAYLAFQHDTWLGVQLESWSGTDNFTWNATSVASQTVQWSWSRGEANAMYDEYMDTIYIGSDETNAGGMGEFTSTIVGTHAFLLSRSTFLPASTDIDDSVWLAILFMSIATLINFVGYVRKIGLLQIVSFLVLLIGIFTAVDVWMELWTLPTLFILSNAVIFIMGMMRKS